MLICILAKTIDPNDKRRISCEVTKNASSIVSCSGASSFDEPLMTRPLSRKEYQPQNLTLDRSFPISRCTFVLEFSRLTLSQNFKLDLVTINIHSDISWTPRVITTPSCSEPCRTIKVLTIRVPTIKALTTRVLLSHPTHGSQSGINSTSDGSSSTVRLVSVPMSSLLNPTTPLKATLVSTTRTITDRNMRSLNDNRTLDAMSLLQQPEALQVVRY